ncbi:30S ribosomal protein S13 [uncultured archaeon]|nr:30S ribosomal protein S13 [uncultured archaeon]
MSEQKIEEKKQPPKGKPGQPKPEELVKLVRILSKDIRGDMKTYRGLCQINGVSWTFSNAVCKNLKLDKNKKIQDLNEQEIHKIEDYIKNPQGMPLYLLNRRKDRDLGTDRHIYGTDLDLQVEFDIKRMKKIKSYKGVRHTLGQPVRGQRTKSHFRVNKKKSGMSAKTQSKPTAKPMVAEKKK